MKKLIYLALSVLFLMQVSIARADEGMWIPLLLGQLNEQEMQEMGMRISAEDIYHINKSSLKDAILLFGGGCTAEIISKEGLILTNHHCGYGEIQSHSTVEHDYLTDGFWAMSRQEELPNPGLTVTRLVRMEDVTGRMLEGVTDDMTEKQRAEVLRETGKKLADEAGKDSHYEAYVRPFYYGNQYYLFVTETFRDVRLVGAPPSNIGKFGGDTDNWMWPRHTGDFSLFRIYVDKDNKPADYSEDNVPYDPLYSIPISLGGVEEDDFTFIFGFPGRTQEYLPSDAIEMITQVQNPARIALRRQKLDIYEAYMNQDPKIRIQYSLKHAHLSNGWKKWIGENRGIAKLDGIEKKMDFEEGFNQWVMADPDRKAKYGGLLQAFNKTYDELTLAEMDMIYLVEAGLGIEIVRGARSLSRLETASEVEDISEEELKQTADITVAGMKDFYKDYYQPIDREVFVTMLETYREKIDPSRLPAIFRTINKKYKGDIEKYADYIFKKSMIADKEEMMEFLEDYRQKDYKKLRKDPAYQMAGEFMAYYGDNVQPKLAALTIRLDSMMRIYMKAQMEYQPDKRFYPDANSTLRVAYGKVKPYYPRDAVFYEYQTTLEGIMEKEDPNVYDYVVEDKLKQLYRDKDYGNYGVDGTMPVCFIATNHTTGGNSGSPALNAEGHLIGLNFDRCWEGTMSDLMFDPDQCRNIMLDVRYFLFIVDKFAGATHLVEEMELVD
ncbi:MAG: S46 family peptidase [Bacteroidales bacterium]